MPQFRLSTLKSIYGNPYEKKERKFIMERAHHHIHGSFNELLGQQKTIIQSYIHPKIILYTNMEILRKTLRLW